MNYQKILVFWNQLVMPETKWIYADDALLYLKHRHSMWLSNS